MPTQAASHAPTWLVELQPWLLLVLALAALGVWAGLWVAVSRLRRLDRLERGLETLEELRHAVGRLASDRGDLDLRRIEHVLLELRDAQKRLEDALLAQVQGARRLDAPETTAPAALPGIGERVTNRLLALGYERIRLVTGPDELEQLSAAASEANGEVVVEARRGGVLCKGRVLLRRGALTDVEIRPAYRLFP